MNQTPEQFTLLAQSEEALFKAADVLHKPLGSLLTQVYGWAHEEPLRQGLALMEEAMKRHNHYADSLK